MKSAVIVFPGSNCDRDLAVGLERASGKPSQMVWHKEASLPEGLDVVAIPGGFSFGDYLRCGAIAARMPIMKAVVEFANKGWPRNWSMQRLSGFDRIRLATGCAHAQRRS